MGRLRQTILAFILILFEPFAQGNEGGEIYFTMSIFWEGSHIRDHNLEALREIRAIMPEIRVHHFVNPAYFTRNMNNAEKIKQLIYQGDEVGLYISPWKSLIDKAGVLFRISPTFWGPTEDSCSFDCGSSVSLAAYSPQELSQLVQVSRNLLAKADLPIGSAYAVAGWQNSEKLFDVAAENGLSFNFSSIPPSRIKRRLQHFPIYQWVQLDWQTIEGRHQSLKSNQGSQLVVPQNGGVADFNTSQELLEFYTEVQKQSHENGTIFNLALHQETASTFKLRIQKLLKTVQDRAKKQNTTLTFDWSSYRNKFKSYW